MSPTVCVHWQGCETKNKLVMFQENYQRQRRDQRREVFEINEIMTRRWPAGKMITVATKLCELKRSRRLRNDSLKVSGVTPSC